MAVDALIFDDDTYFAGLLGEILRGQGLSVKYFPDGNRALDHIRREKPGLLLLDVMMPGLDGISVCCQVRADPQVAGMKVVVVSGKAYAEDKARVAGAKADLFVEKPFNVAEFTRQIRQLLPRSAPSTAQAAPAAHWRVRFWGQGTSADCVSFREGGRLVVLDAGAGLAQLAAEAPDPDLQEVWLLLSHLHPAHVQGLAHAAKLMRPGVRLHLAGPFDHQGSLARVAQRMIPAQLSGLHAWAEGEFEPSAGLRVRALATMHPGHCLGYRVDVDGLRLAFVPDNELAPGWEEQLSDFSEKLLGLAKGADLLIHDARYSDEDYPGFAGRGHSPAASALQLGLRARARRLALYHADPKYSAQDLDRMTADAAAFLAGEMSPPSCRLARPGLEVGV